VQPHSSVVLSLTPSLTLCAAFKKMKRVSVYRLGPGRCEIKAGPRDSIVGTASLLVPPEEGERPSVSDVLKKKLLVSASVSVSALSSREANADD
jgi:hypothetical protein